MTRKTTSIRRTLATILASAAMLAGFISFVPAEPASALGCVLGPSLGAAARDAGISCPETEGGGGGGAAWGAVGGACAYGWSNGQIPAGMLDFLNGSYHMVQDYYLDSGERVGRTTFKKGGKITGQVEIRSHHGVFVMGINVYGRAGLKSEYAYFDCTESEGGAMYRSTPFSGLLPMPSSGTTTTADDTSTVRATGALSALPDRKYLLRVNVTNTGGTRNFADVFLGLDGYTVESFPLLPRVVTCEPYEGLLCTVEDILPGQTVSMILVVTAEGDPAETAGIEVDVSAMGRTKISSSLGRPEVYHPALITNFYELTKP